MRPDLIIFDCDGVLVDSEPLTNAIIAESLSQHGLNLTPRECIDLFVGGTMQGVRDQAIAMGADLPDDWLDVIYGAMFARLEQGVDLIPGVMEVVDRAEALGIHMAVASNGPMAKMRRSLAHSGLWNRLQPHIYSREQHAPKPAPDMLLHAMKVAGVAPERAVMIDDSASGCKSAQNAGIRCIGFATEGQGDSLAAVGAQPVTSMAQVMVALNL